MPPSPDPHPSPSLSLVVPAYNEAPRLALGADRLLRAAAAGALDVATTQIIVVDDGSTDTTSSVAAEVYSPFPLAEVVQLDANRGKGAAIRVGVAHASAPLLLFADADMSIDPTQIPDFVAALGAADLAIGNRPLAEALHPDAHDSHNTSSRARLGRVFNRLVNAATGLGLGDTQCGMKAFRTPVARLLFHVSTIDHYAFDVEVLTIAASLGLTITEVPVHWDHIEGSHIHPFADAPRMLRDLASRRLGLIPPPAFLGLALPDDLPDGLPRDLFERGAVFVAHSALPPRESLVLLPFADADRHLALLADLRRRPDVGFVRPVSIDLHRLRALAPVVVAPADDVDIDGPH